MPTVFGNDLDNITVVIEESQPFKLVLAHVRRLSQLGIQH
jgi:hypothetical protein